MTTAGIDQSREEKERGELARTRQRREGMREERGRDMGLGASESLSLQEEDDKRQMTESGRVEMDGCLGDIWMN